ncbi:hypothetical protein [Lentibacillus sediminis]|uniref:hypothetical protein n=1 Tax=Lentibacillus sediminis TaxID=1940529 RepID=UPI000C1C7EC2|nr:hypothetical protein [Lentibacillus sediminis]
MKLKIILLMIIPLIVLVGCQNKPSNIIEGRSVKDVSIYEIDSGSIVTTLNEEFEEAVYNVNRVQVEDISVVPTSNFSIKFKYASNDRGVIGLQLSNEGEKSYFIRGKDSNSDPRIYEISAEQTSMLRELIKE